jgi:hypothetical protein
MMFKAAKLVRGHPGGVVVFPAEAHFSAGDARVQAEQHHARLWRFKLRGAGQSGEHHFQPAFLAHLAGQAGREVLAGVELAPGPFPVADAAPALRGSPQQQVPALRVRDHGFHRHSPRLPGK